MNTDLIHQTKVVRPVEVGAPDFPEDWERFVEPPTPEELVVIDINALKLLDDLRLAGLA